jgi:hypothetical protein
MNVSCPGFSVVVIRIFSNWCQTVAKNVIPALWLCVNFPLSLFEGHEPVLKTGREGPFCSGRFEAQLSLRR